MWFDFLLCLLWVYYCLVLCCLVFGYCFDFVLVGMLVFLDITIIIIIFLLFVSITTGFMSLNERKANAIFQYRVGPALNATQGAALLPLADGVKLIFSSIL